MSANSKLLVYEVSLLLMRHGRSAIVRELAQQLGRSEEDLWRELDRLRENSAMVRESKRNVAEFSVQKVVEGRPEIAGDIKALEARFNNRTFLPELRDVKRFLEQQGAKGLVVKSRSVAKKRVFETLARMDIDRLKMLTQDAPSSSDSSLGLISDQILRRRGGDA